MKNYCILVIFLFVVTINFAQKNINTHDTNGKTPLLIAVSENNLEKIKSLIQQGVNVNLAEKKGLKGTPLMSLSL